MSIIQIKKEKEEMKKNLEEKIFFAEFREMTSDENEK
jgi:hypothetical protein